MEQRDATRLREAFELLENPGWIARLTNLVGMPIEWAIDKLPRGAHAIVSNATVKAMTKAVRVAVSTMDHRHRAAPSRRFHKGAVVLSGGVGGFFSLAGLAIELPITTVIMLRSIADIARSEGESIAEIGTQLACLQVLALGGKRKSDDAVETSYYAARIALARALSEVSEYLTKRGFVEEGAPVVVRLIARLAARFDVVVTEKVAAEIIPVLGAVGGATVNLLFINHFQSMARGHFIVRNLERTYGAETVKEEYQKLANAPRG